MFKKYDAYKDSELPSFGNVPNHWQVIPLCSITTLKSITNVVNEELLSVYLDKGVIRFDDVTEKRTNVTSLDLSKYQLVEEGDFVLNNQQAWRGSVGVSTYRGIVSPAYLVLKLSPKVDAKFANYFFRNSAMVSQYLINSKGVGTIQRNLYWQHLKRSNVVLPPTQEQTQIAEFLDHKTSEIEQAIAIKEQQIALLNERKQIVIQKAVTQGLNPNVAMKDSGVEWIGQIPQHWIVKKLKYVLKERSERSKDGLEPLLMMSQVHGLVVRSEYSEKTEVAATTVGNKLVYKNDLVFNKLKAHLGVFFSSVHDFAGCVSPDYAVYDCVNYIENTKFLELLFRNPLYIKQFIIRSSGIVEGLIRLYTAELFDLKIGIPPKDEQKAILSYIEEQSIKFNEAVRNYTQQIEKLKEYKTTLINDAVTGKIKVA